ncbi:MAG: GtrA family protein [Bacilli bacterium]|nr:GtrA family protein [Bacilli bacterium]
MKINKQEIIRIAKYVFSAGSSFLLDLGCFTILSLILGSSTKMIFISTIIARIISSIYNYLINSRIVFKNKSKKGVIGYFLLVIIQMIMSATIVSLIKRYLNIFTTIIKFIVDIIIFIVNYIVQKEIVFK